MAWRDREGCLNFVFLGDGRVGRTRNREKRGEGTFHHEKLVLREFRVRVNVPSPIRHVQVPIRRVITPIPGLLYPMRQVVPLSSHIRSYAPHRSPMFPFLFHNSTIIAEHKVKSSFFISPCDDDELTPSTAYTEYSIHRVQHTPSTAYTQDCLCSLHSHDYELTPECSFSCRRASLHDRLPSASSP